MEALEAAKIVAKEGESILCEAENDIQEAKEDVAEAIEDICDAITDLCEDEVEVVKRPSAEKLPMEDRFAVMIKKSKGFQETLNSAIEKLQKCFEIGTEAQKNVSKAIDDLET